MRLLILTQAVDTEDPVLGFFHNWVREIAKHFESVIVICLKKGAYDVPNNVKVFSLGKEDGVGRVVYIVRFFKYIISLRNEYDSVFVHMNQEYIVLAGILWRLLGKPVYFWRNHVYGNVLTRFACFLSTKIFYTSPESFTARYSHGIVMPVGIHTEPLSDTIERDEKKFIVISRITPIKKIDYIVESFVDALRDIPDASLYIYGGPIPETKVYDEHVRTLAQKYSRVHVMGPVNHSETPQLYQGAAFFINMTGKGSYDKTLLEALMYGSIPVSNNPVMRDMVGDEWFVGEDSYLTQKIIKAYYTEVPKREQIRNTGYAFVREHHSLDALVKKLVVHIKS